MTKNHIYKLTIKWTGNKGEGTVNYKSYKRSHSILIENKPEIFASSDSAFRGEDTKHNPEELLVAAISSCHMLWYLHFCAVNGVIVVDYIDNAVGTLTETRTGSGSFSEVILNPVVTVKEESMIEKAIELHKKANKYCFIANSVNFEVKHNIIVKKKE